jgi:hypothetical protein
MPFAVFCHQKKKNRAIDPPCLDPLSFGVDREPSPELLLRRGRVALFSSREKAEEALASTGKVMAGTSFTKDFAFAILECVNHADG